MHREKNFECDFQIVKLKNFNRRGGHRKLLYSRVLLEKNVRA
jgi:hypothetical protein